MANPRSDERTSSFLPFVIRHLSFAARHTEVRWVVFLKCTEYVLLFVGLKVYTTLLPEPAYGEFGLVMTAIALLGYLLTTPVGQAFRRQYHAAEQSGTLRPAVQVTFRWYGAVTLAVLAVGLSDPRALADHWGLAPWTPAAAALLFAASQWRMLGVDVLEIRRLRKAQTLHTLAYRVAQIACIGVLVYRFDRRADVALAGDALASLALAVAVLLPMLGELRLHKRPDPQQARQARRSLRRLAWTFGLPYALLLVLGWVQNFADRYIVGVRLDLAQAGMYVAAFQVCGVPFLLLMNTLNALLTPIAYQHARDVRDPQQLWRADRVLVGGILVYTIAGGLLLGLYTAAGPAIVRLLTNPRYVLAYETILLLALARYVQALAMVLELLFAVHQRMVPTVVYRIIGSILTVTLCWLLAGRWQATGVALGTLIASAAYLLLLTAAPGGCLWMVLRCRRAALRASG